MPCPRRTRTSAKRVSDGKCRRPSISFCRPTVKARTHAAGTAAAMARLTTSTSVLGLGFKQLQRRIGSTNKTESYRIVDNLWSPSTPTKFSHAVFQPSSVRTTSAQSSRTSFIAVPRLNELNITSSAMRSMMSAEVGITHGPHQQISDALEVANWGGA